VDAETAIQRTDQPVRAMNNETAAGPEKVIVSAIQMLLEWRGATGLAVEPGSRITKDLGLDSLELAELSSTLEDELGSDPYSEGIVPETVADLVGYYRR
jgi:hypothetical protein